MGELNLIYCQRHFNNNIYQYSPKYRLAGSHYINGKNRRIFCEECTENELKSCKGCQREYHCGGDRVHIKHLEIKPEYRYLANICHNKQYSECELCYYKYVNISIVNIVNALILSIKMKNPL